MLNVYEFMRDLPANKRLIVNDLVFADYKCPLSETRYDMWSHHNYFVFVIKGKKKWSSQSTEILAHAGDCIFIRKGAHSIYQYFDDEFCSLFMFVPDDFIRDTLINNQVELDDMGHELVTSPILRVDVNEMIKSYFYSFLSYISNTGKTEKKLAELKFRELIILVASGADNKSITGYFHHLCNSNRPSLLSVMESSYTYPMGLDEFARLSGRSLSAFKRDFKKTFKTTPGRWLTNKRLDHGKYLLEQTNMSVTEVVLDCGFRNLSHFSRAFKKQFGITPMEFRKAFK